jgi:cation diffusion facilitator CzcD-associated flavoprotein CzcO
VRESVEVAIIGAGQAGLATSWYLTEAGVEHVVLEAGRVAETWRSRRWDSFCLVTPNWGVTVPGASYSGLDPDGFMSLPELIDLFQNWADSFKAPVQGNTCVSSLKKDGADFVLELTGSELRALTVVVATGGYQRAHLPAGSENLARNVHQVLAEDYRNPRQLPPGAVLIIGSGQTGCQLAEEIQGAGRTVFVACGRAPWIPRRMKGHDFAWWTRVSGWLDRTNDKVPSAERLMANPQATGHGGGHDLHYRTLHARGVELVGRFAGADGSKIYFADDLWASVDFGDARLRDMLKAFDAYCKDAGLTALDFEFPEPFRLKTRTELDVARDGIGTVIWTSGYRPNYGWIDLPVFDDMGFPVQRDGCCVSAKGLYFMGVPWMRKSKSAILYGVGEDAELVVQGIVENRA